MKLKKIELKDFRNHGHSTLNLEDASFVVIRGSNHSGKSSIGQAVSMNLALSTSSLDPQGRNFVRKIKKGETKGIVTIDIQGKHLIQNTVTLNTNTSGRVSRATCLDDESWKPLPFDNFLTRYKDALLVATNSDYFILRMDETRQKSLLAKLALPERYDFPEDRVKAVESALGEGAIDFNGEPFAVIDKTYKRVYEERAIVNRQIKEFVIPEALPAVKGVDSASLQKELDDARFWRNKLNEEKDLAVKAANEVEVKRATLNTKVEHLRERCREINTKIEGLAPSILSPEKLAELQKIVQNSERYALLNKSLGELVAKIDEQNKELERCKSLTGEGLRCSKCDQPITKEYVAGISKFAEDSLAEATASKAEILEELQQLGDVDGATLAISNHTKAADEKDGLAKTLAEKVEQGKNAVKELKALPPFVDAGAKFTEELAEKDAQITKLVEQLSPVITAEQRSTEIRTKTEALEKLKKQAESLDKLVEYFGKDGVKSKLLAEHVGGFERDINETLEAWGYKASLSIEPYEFLVTNAEGDTSLITELADSEQLMFSVAFQSAVSRAAGIGFIVADRMDTFLPTERQKANRCLYKATQDGTLEQAILIMSDESEEVPKLADSKFFIVKNGKVTELKVAA
jgi:DNA repair exonuclease SbcCD ATPase subunit